ncbi:SUMO1 sentrin specific peptidase 1 [Homalodisca vitripennis]|nr:SUMO1 sentrin specific peptidase 1 [Homalodisca vitripennis]
MARVVRKQVRLLPCDSERLFPGQLLNGEVISAYLRLLERRNAMDHNLPNVLALDSYFFTVLKRSGHERARGHQRDLDLWNYEKILLPVHEKLADVGHWWLLVVEPRKETISAYDSLKGRNHKPAMDLLREYLKKEEMRAKTEARSWCLYGERSCPSQDNLVDCGVFLCAIAGAICGGREAKELRVDGREFRRQMAKELREDSVTENKSRQPELFPGEEPDWSFEDLAEELDQLTIQRSGHLYFRPRKKHRKRSVSCRRRCRGNVLGTHGGRQVYVPQTHTTRAGQTVTYGLQIVVVIPLEGVDLKLGNLSTRGSAVSRSSDVTAAASGDD